MEVRQDLVNPVPWPLSRPNQTYRNRLRTRLAHLGALAVLALACAIVTSGCEDNPVGRICVIEGVDEINFTETVVASPAIECQSRTCLRVPLEVDSDDLPENSRYESLCTAECTADEDCDRVPESPCVTGFTCAVPVVVGPFCCQRLCVCKDYLILPDSGSLPTPEACVADNPDNTCCNLPGRETCE